jgi:hypothetical protein
MSSAPIARATALAAALAFAVAGCGGSHATAPPSSPTRSLAAAWHQVVLCARAHGMPGLQEPRIDERTGKAIFPRGLSVPQETRQACQRMYDRLMGNAPSHPPTATEMAALLRFARCMRAHGIPDWPDPRPDGTFAPDSRITRSLKSQFRTQLTTCEHFNPDHNGRVYFSRS